VCCSGGGTVSEPCLLVGLPLCAQQAAGSRQQAVGQNKDFSTTQNMCTNKYFNEEQFIRGHTRHAVMTSGGLDKCRAATAGTCSTNIYQRQPMAHLFGWSSLHSCQLVCCC
jgi:hypothetical protein